MSKSDALQRKLESTISTELLKFGYAPVVVSNDRETHLGINSKRNNLYVRKFGDIYGYLQVHYRINPDGIYVTSSVTIHHEALERLRAKFCGLPYNPLFPTMTKVELVPVTYGSFKRNASERSLLDQMEQTLKFLKLQCINWIEDHGTLEAILAAKPNMIYENLNAVPIGLLLAGRFEQARSAALAPDTRYKFVNTGVTKGVLEYCDKKEIPHPDY